MTKKELLVIIPAYNEEKNIPKVLEQLEEPAVASIADVLVVDDASQDATGRIVREHHYALVKAPFNLGYGSILQLGYKYAVRKGYKYVIQMDADGQHDACNIPIIYHKLTEKDESGQLPDIVLASRFMEGSSCFPVSVPKKIAYGLFRFMLRLATGKAIADPTTGMQGLNRRAFFYYAKYNHFDDRYPDANMIMQMLLLQFHVVQVPAVMHMREDGKSMHSGLKVVWYMFRMVISVAAVLFRIKVLKVDVERI